MQTNKLLALCDLLSRIMRETRGAVATEYAFLIVFIAIVAALGMVFLGVELGQYFETMGNAIGSAASQGS